MLSERAAGAAPAVLRPDGPVLSVAYESTQSTRRRDFHSPTGGFLRKSPLHPPRVPIRIPGVSHQLFLMDDVGSGA